MAGIFLDFEILSKKLGEYRIKDTLPSGWIQRLQSIGVHPWSNIERMKFSSFPQYSGNTNDGKTGS